MSNCRREFFDVSLSVVSLPDWDCGDVLVLALLLTLRGELALTSSVAETGDVRVLPLLLLFGVVGAEVLVLNWLVLLLALDFERCDVLLLLLLLLLL